MNNSNQPTPPSKTPLTFEALPEVVRAWLQSDAATAVILELNQRFGLIGGQKRVISDTITQLVIGALPPDTFITKLKEVGTLSDADTHKVAAEIKGRILVRVASELNTAAGVDIKKISVDAVTAGPTYEEFEKFNQQDITPIPLTTEEEQELITYQNELGAEAEKNLPPLTEEELREENEGEEGATPAAAPAAPAHPAPPVKAPSSFSVTSSAAEFKPQPSRSTSDIRSASSGPSRGGQPRPMAYAGPSPSQTPVMPKATTPKPVAAPKITSAPKPFMLHEEKPAAPTPTQDAFRPSFSYDAPVPKSAYQETVKPAEARFGSAFDSFLKKNEPAPKAAKTAAPEPPKVIHYSGLKTTLDEKGNPLPPEKPKGG